MYGLYSEPNWKQIYTNLSTNGPPSENYDGYTLIVMSRFDELPNALDLWSLMIDIPGDPYKSKTTFSYGSLGDNEYLAISQFFDGKTESVK